MIDALREGCVESVRSRRLWQFAGTVLLTVGRHLQTISMWRRLSTFSAALLMLASGPSDVHCSRDGFNIYKDMLRGKIEGAEDVSSIPKLFFYRTPLLGQQSDGRDYVVDRDALQDTLLAVDTDAGAEDSPKSGFLRDRFPLPRTAVKRDTGPRYIYRGSFTERTISQHSRTDTFRQIAVMLHCADNYLHKS
ncbi:uncharacterized protein LOC110834994 isoform X2 [Zootermopsis nevadensis]|uniref:uncharacterized protein LOC110834994 isoform X2 n=1 Tax=Zootermopsis nevadensis TaxID=136037 RepID=UPI000B8ECE67|nr:uncharacterized protein LOC110834994 isoform X2 [Zootermopsis nevadensis]